MECVILLGTTAGTTWRLELIERLVGRGVSRERIINPHNRGGKWTPAHMESERAAKRDPNTIVFIYVCPAVLEDDSLDPEDAAKKREMLGPASMKEIGQYGWSSPARTAIVLDYQLFTEGKRPRKVLVGFEAEFLEDFGTDGPPYFSSMTAAEDWLVAQLAGK